MVIVPGKFIFACTPRTASRSVTKALLTVPGATGKHMHDPPADLLAAKKEHGLPIVTFIREPAAQLLSYWWRAHRTGTPNRHISARPAVRGNRAVEAVSSQRTSFPTYIRSLWAGRFLVGKDRARDRRLSCYHHVADHFFPYELGLQKFFDLWNISVEEIPYESDYRTAAIPPVDRNYITEEHRKVVEEEFPEDVALYKQEMARWSM